GVVGVNCVGTGVYSVQVDRGTSPADSPPRALFLDRRVRPPSSEAARTWREGPIMLIRPFLLAVLLGGIALALPIPGHAAPKELESRIADLENAVAALQGQIGALQTSIASLQGVVAALQGQLSAVQTNTVLALGPFLAVQPAALD